MKPIVIYTVPKSGTHMVMQAFAYFLKQSGQNIFSNEIYEEVPMYNHTNMIDLQAKIFATHPEHVFYDIMEQSFPKAHYITIFRHPLDVMISMYFFFEKYRNKDTDFGEFFTENIIAICEQMIFHHQYIQERHGTTFFYEEVMADKTTLLKKVMSILNLDPGSVNIEAAIQATSIEQAKKSEQEKGIHKVGSIQNGPFYRSGTVGQYKNVFSEDVLEALNKQIPDHLLEGIHNIGYKFAL